MSLNRDQTRKLREALTAGNEELFQLVLNQEPAVLLNLLKNPHVTDQHLLALLRRRDLSEELLKSVSRHELVKSTHKLKVALVYNSNTPAAIALSLLPHLYLFELLNLCILPGSTPDQRLAAERQVIQRLPTIELGQKITLARRGSGKILEALLKQGEPQVMSAALDNPHLKEIAIVSFLRGGKATAATISQIARHSRWSNRHSLRLNLLKHRLTPAIWYTLWLPGLRTFELDNLLASRQLGYQQKELVRQENRKRSGRTDF
jgi:hypothetical protein